MDDGTTYAEMHYRPFGVVGAIGPWNWPMMISVWQIAPALRMGNTVVIKPSEYTPLSVLALVHVINQVLPEGVLHVVSGGRDVGAAAEHPPGHRQGHVHRIHRHRQGHHPVLGRHREAPDPGAGRQRRRHRPARRRPEGHRRGPVLGRVHQHRPDLRRAQAPLRARPTLRGGLRGAAEVARNMPMGVGLDEANVLGPLQNKAQFDIVASPRRQGHRLRRPHADRRRPATNCRATSTRATLIADIDHGHPLVDEEQFGPVLPIIKVDSDRPGRRSWPTRLDVGLGASVWSADRDAARAVAARLQAGTVWINSHGGVDPRIPFGGAKASGYGVEFGVDGLKALGQPQVING